jgi:putative FmdB family regulatory protein
MPTYDYGCATCGPFSESHPMSEYASPQPCPGCGEDAPRVVLTAPALGGNAAPQSAAFPQPRMHPGGCSCCAAPRRLAAEAV